VCPGCWLPTTPPAFATLGQAKPFFLASGDQFRPLPPPAFGSPAFVAGLAEVRRIADTRTTEQDSIAKFWALGAGTVSAQGYLNGVASELAVEHHLSERETAHRLALLNMAAFDVIIASHEAKYHYWLVRPSQADPAIVRAIPLPSFPSYPSNHSALVASAATVLGAMFPRERARLDAMAEEGAISRLYGGIHYRFDTEAGLALGRRVAAWTLAHDVVGHEPFVLK
jgi:membrane-associated phospholipid phosphatase